MELQAGKTYTNAAGTIKVLISKVRHYYHIGWLAVGEVIEVKGSDFFKGGELSLWYPSGHCRTFSREGLNLTKEVSDVSCA